VPRIAPGSGVLRGSVATTAPRFMVAGTEHGGRPTYRIVRVCILVAVCALFVCGIFFQRNLWAATPHGDAVAVPLVPPKAETPLQAQRQEALDEEAAEAEEGDMLQGQFEVSLLEQWPTSEDSLYGVARPLPTADLSSANLKPVASCGALNALPLREPQEFQTIDNSGRVPNIVHFVFGSSDSRGGSAEFTFLNYLAVVSALTVQRPTAVMAHCLLEPVGFFWDLVKTRMTVVQRRDLHSIFSNEISVAAHKVQIIALEALIQHGGIYLGSDVVTLRPYDALMDHDVVMGRGGAGNTTSFSTSIILASPGARFLWLWYDGFMEYSSATWQKQSETLLAQLAKSNPHLFFAADPHLLSWPHHGGAADTTDFSGSYAVQISRRHLGHKESSSFGMAWVFRCKHALASKLQALVPDPLISVVMPCYNQAKFIQESITSVTEQIFPSWEVIVVDDHSPDDCMGVTKRWLSSRGAMNDTSRIRVLQTPENRGLAEARNYGIEHARGHWICALDADDTIKKEYFLSAVEAMSQDPMLHIITSSQEFFGESNWQWEIREFSIRVAQNSGPLPVMSLYLRSLWEQVGGYSSALPWGNEDYDFWLKLAELGVRAHILPHKLVRYRYKQQSMMRDSVKFVGEERAMLHTRHPHLYAEVELLVAASKVMDMCDETRNRLQSMEINKALLEEETLYISFWLALSDLRRRALVSAALRLRASMQLTALGWLPRLFFLVTMCEMKGPEATASSMSHFASQYPDVNRTSNFQLYDANCRRAMYLPKGPPRHDL